jgi:hypothetical protein
MKMEHPSSARGGNGFRIGGLAFAGLLATSGVLLYGDRAFGAAVQSTRPSIGRIEPGYFVLPSPDGRWAALQQSGADRCETELRILDLESGRARKLVVAGAAPLCQMWSADNALLVSLSDSSARVACFDPATLAELSEPDATALARNASRTRSDGWSQWKQDPAAQGSQAALVYWPARALEASFDNRPGNEIRTTHEPGIVFQGLRAASDSAIVRHELESGEARELARIPHGAGWSPAPAGARIAVWAEQQLRVLDAQTGQVQLELPAGRGLVCWAERDSRWLATTCDGAVVLHDLERGTARTLCDDAAASFSIHVLPQERILWNRGAEVYLLDADAPAPRRIYPAVE